MAAAKRPRVVIDGLYGIESHGDDAMLLALVQGLRDRVPALHVSVLSRDPLQLRRSYGLHAIRNFDHPPFVPERGPWFYGFNAGQPRKHLGAVRETIARADLLLIGGGNLLLDITHDWLRGPIAWHAISSELARTYRVPYALFANSIGPFATPWGRDRAAAIVRGAFEVGVRDRESFELASSMRESSQAVELLPDPALRLRPDTGAGLRALLAVGWKPEPAPTLALSVRDLSWLHDPGADGYLRSMVELCRRTIDELGARLIFVPQCVCRIGRPEEDDRRIAQVVVSGLHRSERCFVLTESMRPETLMGVYAHANAALTTRLHGAVFAVAAGTPLLALAYLPKVRGFLRQLELEDACVPLEAVHNIGSMLARIERLLTDSPHTGRVVRARVEHVAARLDGQLDRFAEVLCRNRA